jgi:hypothetical protein
LKHAPAPPRSYMEDPFSNKISGAGTNFGLLVHVLPEPNNGFRVYTKIYFKLS